VKLLEATFAELSHVLAERYGGSAFHAAAIMKTIYRTGSSDGLAAPLWDSTRLLRRVRRDIQWLPGEVVSSQRSGELVKFATRLSDGLVIESVLLPMVRHHSVCVSTQVGCRMGCRFCETGRNGFARNLTVEEIVGQVLAAGRFARGPVRNVVFMGMGEPLDNADNLLAAMAVLNDQRGADIAMRRMTVSTVGLPRGIRRLGALSSPRPHLAVSLNAAEESLRTELMPINARHGLASLLEVLRDYPLPARGTIMFAYILIPGVNDGERRARLLADLLAPLPAKINLIPYNPGTHAPYRGPSEEEVRHFADALKRHGLTVIRRTTRGQELMAACGQLSGAAGAEG
jgi:23S rRNA (adenine2503-C2)-methyltransferase